MNTRHRRTTSRLTAVGALLAAVVAAGLGAAPADAATPTKRVVLQAHLGRTLTTDVSRRTARLVDIDNGFLVFINKSRADLCTPERIVFENALEAWFADPQGPPPVEPVASQQGVRPVRFTSVDLPGGGFIARTTGLQLPVEVWRLDDQGDGIDCTATDGPGAALFATGAMDWTDVRTLIGDSFSSIAQVRGRVKGVDGRRYSYLIRYEVQQDGTDPEVFTPTISLVPVR